MPLKNMRVLIFSLTILIFSSCDKEPRTREQFRAFKEEIPCDNEGEKLKTLEFETFSLNVPCDWKIDTLYGKDDHMDVIKTNSGEVIHWNFGQGYEMNSNQDQKKVLSVDLLDSMLRNYRDTSRYQFVNKRPEEIKQEDYYTFQDKYVTIDGLRAKITAPKEQGKAYKIINFEISNELPVKDMGLYIVGHNLSRQTDSLLMRAFETVRFKRE